MNYSIGEIFCAFWDGLMNKHISRKECIREDKVLREQLTEKQIDKMVENSFPASDPPSTY